MNTFTGTVGPATVTITLPEPEPAPTVARPLRIGVNVTPAQYGTWYGRFPQPAFARVFTPTGKGLYGWATAAMRNLPPGTIPHVSHKDRLDRGTLNHFWDGLPDTAELWHTYHHEPQGAGQPDLDAYAAYWRELRRARDAHPNRQRITLVMVHTLYAVRHKPIDWRPWVEATLDAADVQGWDCYRDTAFDAYEPAAANLGLPADAAREYGCRWSVPELGSTLCTWDRDGAGRAGWYRDCVRFAAAHDCEAVGFWSASDQSGALDYRPHDQATAAAWSELLAAQT